MIRTKIIGDFGEYFVCNWLCRFGWEVIRADHKGIDLIAYHPKNPDWEMMGITVKARIRDEKTKNAPVHIFKNNDRKNLIEACKGFKCKPWIAIYVESEGKGEKGSADLFLTSLEHYDANYRKSYKAIEDWMMSKNHRSRYSNDPNVKHLSFQVDRKKWNW